MPTYEYACANCDNHWEEVQRITEAPLETCPRCQQKSARRQISGGSFILKGGGWYADLYSTPKGGKKEDGGTKSESKENGGSKSDAAPEKADKKAEKTEAPAKKASAPPAATGSSGNKT